ncbi:MAG: hypothetical protein KatS3mg102_2700 [Planctomycetota bacterium]|nr:MAG: hypothetical protein KatS3mg102_2700 [Planctomycetota bacterium]
MPALAITDRNGLVYGVVRAHVRGPSELRLQLLIGAEVTPIDGLQPPRAARRRLGRPTADL